MFFDLCCFSTLDFFKKAVNASYEAYTCWSHVSIVVYLVMADGLIWIGEAVPKSTLTSSSYSSINILDGGQ